MSNNTQGKMLKFSEDDVIIKEGEYWSFCYKVISGKLAMYTNYGTEKEYLVGIISEQRFLGEVGFLTGTASPYTIVCVTDVVIMAIRDDEFEPFIARNAKNAIDLMKHMATSILTLNHHIELINDELEHRPSPVSAPVPIDINEKLQAYRHMGKYL